MCNIQKILNWVLAAILIICGASVMTSCSSSEDNAAQACILIMV